MGKLSDKPVTPLYLKGSMEEVSNRMASAYFDQWRSYSVRKKADLNILILVTLGLFLLIFAFSSNFM